MMTKDEIIDLIFNYMSNEAIDKNMLYPAELNNRIAEFSENSDDIGDLVFDFVRNAFKVGFKTGISFSR